MNRPGKKGWFVLGGIFLAVLALLAILYPEAKKRWTTPLGPAASLPSPSPGLPTATESTPVSDPAASETESNPEAETATETPTSEATTAAADIVETPRPLCGGPPVMTILAVGADNRADNYVYGLADVIRIIRVDFVTPKVTILTLPRDLWVEIPEISDHYGITHGKLNQAYFYGTPGMGYYDGPGGAAGLLARALDVNFGLRIDHYGVVNMKTFVRIVDAVGGVDVHLPYDVDGRPTESFPYDLGYYAAGVHHLNGEQALTLSRIRHKYSDFFRSENQSRIMCALKDKITSPAIFPEVSRLIADFQNSVLTDLTPEQLAQLACLATKLESKDIVFANLPEDILTTGRVYSQGLNNETYAVEADPEAVRGYVEQFTAGTWPEETTEPFCP